MSSPGSQVEVRFLDARSEWVRGPLADVDAEVTWQELPGLRSPANLVDLWYDLDDLCRGAMTLALDRR